MGGCFAILLLPVLIGTGVVIGALYFALPIYAVFAVVMVLFAAVAYALLQRNGIFTRYAEDDTWRRPVSVAAKWLLRFDIAFFIVTGILAVVGWAFFFWPVT